MGLSEWGNGLRQMTLGENYEHAKLADAFNWA